MSRDNGKPRCEFLRVFNRRQRLESKQQRVLRNVFRIVTTNNRLSRAHYSRAIARNQLVERREVAQNCCDHQHFVWSFYAGLPRNRRKIFLLDYQSPSINKETFLDEKDSGTKKNFLPLAGRGE